MKASPALIEANRRICQEQKQKAIERYYASPNFCHNCGTMIMVKEGQRATDVRRKKFCNRSCSVQYNNRLIPKRKSAILVYKQDSQNASLQVFRLCKRCNTEFEVGRSACGKVRQRKFCDTCVSESRKQGNKREGGVTLPKPIEQMTKQELRGVYENNPFRFKVRVTNHARRLFKKSKRENKCVVCGYTKFCEIAHINDVSAYSEQDLIGHINHITNLIPLCPNHHKEFDKHLLEPEDAEKIAVLAQLVEHLPSK